MNDRTPFDDLARRKLNERDFPVAPEAWADMEKQLDALPRKRDRRPLILLAALILVGGAVWYMAGDDDANDAAPLVHAEQPRPAATESQPVAAEMDPAGPGTGPNTERTETQQPAEHAPAPTESRAEKGTAPARTHSSTTTPALATPVRATAPVPPPTVITAPATIAMEQGTEPTIIPHENNRDAADPDHGDRKESVLSTTPGAEPIVIVQPTTHAEPSRYDTSTASPKDHGQHDPTTPPPTIAPPPPAVAGTEIGSPQQTPGSEPATTVLNVLRDTLTSADSTLTVTTDTSATVPTPDTTRWAPPALPYLEATVWGGLYNTTTRYTGIRSERWAADHAGLSSIGFGAELMRMGRRFGMGLGLHYSTYAERMDAEQLSSTWNESVVYHHLEGVDTTIMIVNGTTVINGQTYYVTQTLDTTILVLVTTTGEETFSQVQRNELHRTNRTSYVEIPLLLDAHATLGRWHFGVRGGPMLGVLQGRRGMLPGSTSYTNMADEAFKELTFGWTMQGYIRYRVAGGWLLGIGPSARGQLFNTMQGDALVRRSSAFGGQFSVSYLLP